MAWKLLFGSDVGLFSLVTIAVVIVIGAGLYLFVRRKMAEEEGQPSPDARGLSSSRRGPDGQKADVDTVAVVYCRRHC